MQTLNLVQISLQDLRGLFRQELDEYFNENALAVHPTQKSKRILSIDELRKERPVLGSKSTIYKKTMLGIIPHSKQGKKLIFDLDAVDAWLLSNKAKTANDIEDETLDTLSKRRRA